MKIDRTKLLGFKLSAGAQVTGAKLGINPPDPKGPQLAGAKLAVINQPDSKSPR